MKKRYRYPLFLLLLHCGLLFGSMTGRILIDNRETNELSFPAGSSFLLSVHDSDQNQDSTQIEKVEIVISLNDNRIIERVNLTETDSSSGIFEERIILSGNTLHTNGIVIEAAQNDVITITYTDFENEDGSEENISRTVNITGSVLFTDASGVEQLNFAQGATIYVQVDDTDRNVDVNTAETVTVTVTSETSSAGETVTLTETGVSTGVFLG